MTNITPGTIYILGLLPATRPQMRELAVKHRVDYAELEQGITEAVASGQARWDGTTPRARERPQEPPQLGVPSVGGPRRGRVT
jgi:hypothetical protein